MCRILNMERCKYLQAATPRALWKQNFGKYTGIVSSYCIRTSLRQEKIDNFLRICFFFGLIQQTSSWSIQYLHTSRNITLPKEYKLQRTRQGHIGPTTAPVASGLPAEDWLRKTYRRGLTPTETSRTVTANTDSVGILSTFLWRSVSFNNYQASSTILKADYHCSARWCTTLPSLVKGGTFDSNIILDDSVD